MKKLSRITLVLLISFFTGSVAFASFPYTSVVNNENSNTVTVEETTIQKEEINSPYSSQSMDEDTIITLILAVFLGWIAAHRWYKNKPLEWNILYLICVLGPIIFGSILGFPLLGLIGFIWWAVDVIHIVTGEF
ncbi:MAG: TM2 domain-containing protein [Bacteroidales bacterium]|jgi:uncharacterized membrane protein YbjE (DUF340 family)|nr:TM2 domain-containing protein [Bacteroidales bacterium]